MNLRKENEDMTNEEAIAKLKNFAEHCYPNEEFLIAIEALEEISHLVNRPCEACEFHGENGCCKWECVFKGV